MNKTALEIAKQEIKELQGVEFAEGSGFWKRLIVAAEVVRLSEENAKENFNNQQGSDAIIMAIEDIVELTGKVAEQAEALAEAEKVIKNHSGGIYHACDGDWDWAKTWLAKYGTKEK